MASVPSVPSVHGKDNIPSQLTILTMRSTCTQAEGILRTLSPYPSVTGSETPLALYLERKFRELGMTVEMQAVDSDRYNVIGKIGYRPDQAHALHAPGRHPGAGRERVGDAPFYPFGPGRDGSTAEAPRMPRVRWLP